MLDQDRPIVPNCDVGKDCHMCVYTPTALRVFFILAYRVVSGVVEYIPRNPQTGESLESIHIQLGTVEIINGNGLEYNIEEFAKLRAKIAELSDFDASWEQAGA